MSDERLVWLETGGSVHLGLIPSWATTPSDTHGVLADGRLWWSYGMLVK